MLPAILSLIIGTLFAPVFCAVNVAVAVAVKGLGAVTVSRIRRVLLPPNSVSGMSKWKPPCPPVDVDLGKNRLGPVSARVTVTPALSIAFWSMLLATVPATRASAARTELINESAKKTAKNAASDIFLILKLHFDFCILNFELDVLSKADMNMLGNQWGDTDTLAVFLGWGIFIEDLFVAVRAKEGEQVFLPGGNDLNRFC